MNLGLARFRLAYTQAFEDHLDDPGERTLRAAYELGRDAVAGGLGVLEIAAVHHDVLAEAVGRHGDGVDRVLRAGGAFLQETLSAYEMVGRGFQEVVDLATVERRHAQAIRRLSGFLGDRSLATDDPDSLREVLQLVAEEALELVDAGGCIVALRTTGEPLWTTASVPVDLAATPAAVSNRRNLAVHAVLQASGGVLRLAAGKLAAHPVIAAVPGLDREPEGWLGAVLTALDGRPLGFLEVFDWQRPGPTDLDEALGVHLAEMAAATLERRRLYQS